MTHKYNTVINLGSLKEILESPENPLFEFLKKHNIIIDLNDINLELPACKATELTPNIVMPIDAIEAWVKVSDTASAAAKQMREIAELMEAEGIASALQETARILELFTNTLAVQQPLHATAAA